jgi:hypothetical protein
MNTDSTMPLNQGGIHIPVAEEPKSFSVQMMEKYPHLFPKDAEGNPRQPDCGFYCPPGWDHIIEQLLASIDWRIRNPKQVQKYKTFHKFLTWSYKKVIKRVTNPVRRLIDPFDYLHWDADGKRKEWVMITPEQRKKIEAEHPFRCKLLTWFDAQVRKLFPIYRWKSIPCPPVTIDQVKEKFGTLRFYYSGGDEHIASIVSFAEVLTGKVCEETGAPADLVRRGYWYKTLSPEAASARGFKAAK